MKIYAVVEREPYEAPTYLKYFIDIENARLYFFSLKNDEDYYGRGRLSVDVIETED